MQEKRYKLTEKGRKLLKELNTDTAIDMQDLAANLLGFSTKKDNNAREEI